MCKSIIVLTYVASFQKENDMNDEITLMRNEMYFLQDVVRWYQWFYNHNDHGA